MRSKLARMKSYTPIYSILLVLSMGVISGLGYSQGHDSAMHDSVRRELELGFLMQLHIDVRGNPHQWVDKFCELALAQQGEAYANFVRLVRQESYPLTYQESVRLPEKRRFSVRNVAGNVLDRVLDCLEHAGATAPAGVQYDLYWLNRNIGSRRPYHWLKGAANAGSPDAQVDFARSILEQLVRAESSHMPLELRHEVEPERFQYWLKRAINNGSSRGLYELAQLHYGRYSNQEWSRSYIDVPRAIQELEKVVRDTYQAAMTTRAVHPSKTWTPVEAIEGPALVRSRAAADLGQLFFEGKRVQQDYATALRWLKEVDEVYIWHCRAPLAGVRYMILTMYEKGLGVERDLGKANYYRQHLSLGC